MLPLVGRSKVLIMEIAVVFPAPLGPKSPKISPWFTEILRPLSAGLDDPL